MWNLDTVVNEASFSMGAHFTELTPNTRSPEILRTQQIRLYKYIVKSRVFSWTRNPLAITEGNSSPQRYMKLLITRNIVPRADGTMFCGIETEYN